MPSYALLLGDCSAKPKGSIRLLVMYVDTAFWLCTAANQKLNKGCYDERIMNNYTGCYIYEKVKSPIYLAGIRFMCFSSEGGVFQLFVSLASSIQ